MNKAQSHKPIHAFRLLHTADWHLGKLLYTQTRYEEFAEFLAWLLHSIDAYAVDALLVAGDIFDTMSPSAKAQKLYYDFLGEITKTCCRHVIITAGNHDSPSLLDAPKNLLGALNLHVVGTPTTEVIVLQDDDTPRLIVAPIAYLRDKDVRSSQFGDSESCRQNEQLAGFYDFYAKSFDKARAHKMDVPIIASGHFFAQGADISALDDGMRDYSAGDGKEPRSVGGLGEINVHKLPAFDYIALGHIHKLQRVGAEHIYYSGSPLALGFGESQQQKHVIIADFIADSSDHRPTLSTLAVPCFRKLVRIQGDLPTIYDELTALAPDSPTPYCQAKTIWAEITYTGDHRPTLVQDINAFVDKLAHISVLSIINHQLTYHPKIIGTSLQQMTPTSVFFQLISDSTAHNDDEKTALRAAYALLLNELQDTDIQDT